MNPNIGGLVESKVKKIEATLCFSKDYIMSRNVGSPKNCGGHKQDVDALSTSGSCESWDTKENKDIRAAKLFKWIPGEKYGKLRARLLRRIHGWLTEEEKQVSAYFEEPYKDDAETKAIKENPKSVLEARQRLLLKESVPPLLAARQRLLENRPVPSFEELHEAAEWKIRGPTLLINIHLLKILDNLEARNALAALPPSRG